MIVEYTTYKNQPVIFKLFRTDPTEKREREIITDFRPYFYIESEGDTEMKTLEGVSVEKKYTRNPYDIPQIRDEFEHFEADIPYTDRYVLDTMDLPLVDDYLRVLYLDIETYTRSGQSFPDQEHARDPICMICVYDNLTEQYHTFGDGNEVQLLKDFAAFIKEANPDVITAWNSDFDFGTIYNRMKKCHLNTNILSPLNYVSYDKWGIKISGVDTLDLLKLYKNLHFGELDSFALNSVGEHELGLKKIDTHMLPGDMLDKGLKKELEEYCLRDVEIMVELDKKMKIIDFYHLLQRISGASSIGGAQSFSKIFDLLMIKKAHNRNIVLPTGGTHEKTDIVGARVLDPVKGLHANVAVLDIVGMYVNIFKLLNLGYETVGTFPSNNCVTVKTDTETLYVNQEKKSLWVEILDDIMEERLKYKKLMLDSRIDSPEYELYYQEQYAMKTLIAAAYGVSNFRHFRLYNYRVSAIITFIGREMNKFMEKIANESGYKTIYGDTDSIFVEGLESVEDSLKLESVINNSWKRFLNELEIDADPSVLSIEFDALYDRLFFTEAKKRYAGHYVYKNGEETDSTKIVGFQTKRSDSSAFTKELQTKILDIILNDPIPDVERNISKLIKKSYDIVRDIDLLKVGIPKGFGKKPETYKIQNLNTKAVIYSQKYLGLAQIELVKPLVFSIKRNKPHSKLPATKSVAIDPEDKSQMQLLVDNFYIDWDIMIPKLIERPTEKILNAFSLNVADVKAGNRQANLFNFD